MIWYKVPFNITLFASILPWLAAYLDKKWVTYIPILIALLFYLFFETVKKNSRFLSFNNTFKNLFIFTSISVVYQTVSGLGLGSGGLLILIILFFIFYKFLDNSNFKKLDLVLIDQIKILYMVHVLFIFGELIFRILGGTDIIVSLVGNTTEVMKYKMYNKAAFLRFIGFSDMTGLGGLLLGSQGAGQVALFAVFLFAPFYKLNPLYNNSKSHYMIFVLSIFTFLSSITMTASILFLMMFLAMLFIIPTSKINSKKYRLGTIFFSIIFLSQLSRLLFFNIKNAYDLFVYYNSFMNSLRYYLNLNILGKLFGLGKNTNKIMTSNIELPQGVTPADFGVGMLLNAVGLVLFGFFSLFVVRLFFHICRKVKDIIIVEEDYINWVWLSVINIFLALGWLLSLIHYTPAVELGGRELFAFHLSSSVFAFNKLKYTMAERNE